MDADIEKSSSSNLDTSLVIPLQSAANLSAAASVDKKSQAKELVESAEANKTAAKTHLKGKFYLSYFATIKVNDFCYFVSRQKRVLSDGLDSEFWEQRSLEDVNRPSGMHSKSKQRSQCLLSVYPLF